MKSIYSFPYEHRDISWLDFNYRVLQEVKDPSVPLFERIKFLAIYSSNLGEFFKVRVANHRNLLRVGKKTRKSLDYDPEEVMTEILEIVNKRHVEFLDILNNQILPELRQHNIYLILPEEMTDLQKQFADEYFRDKLQPFVQPVLLIKDKIRPFLNDAQLYLVLSLKDKSADNPKTEYAIVKVPSDHLPRFIELPSEEGRNDIIFLDDLVRHCSVYLFPGYQITGSYTIKITRDAELYIDDEYSGDLVMKIKTSIQKRNVGVTSRMVYDHNMPGKMLRFLMEMFQLGKLDLVVEGRYHNNFDLFSFPTFGKQSLMNSPLPPLPYLPLESAESFFDEMKRKDHLIMVPFHSYESVIRFFEKAAEDPSVTHIKIIQYRVAKQSRIMQALMRAAALGKNVSAFIELKARFDEQANLNWGEKLEKAGVHVHYSFPGLKVHSKLAIIRRVEDGKAQYYCYMATGNFHEGTAKLYSDYGLFTCDQRITSEAIPVFNFLENIQLPDTRFKHLLVGQFNLKPKLLELIEDEINFAKAGKKAEIFLKCNSLQDPDMIEKLYEASNAGVKIRLIIRGLCSLVPGVKNFSENIKVISIIDRFLEHARVFKFRHGGKDLIYLSSADWMVRNLSHRIETAFPIFDENIKDEINQVMEIQWMDNVKARLIHPKHNNEYAKNVSELPNRSQIETYFFYKRQNEHFLMEQAQEQKETIESNL